MRVPLETVDAEPAPLGRILLTGATGRVGARLLPHLKRLGGEARLLVWGPGPGPGGGRLVTGDLRDPAVCRSAVEGVDAVVHIASAFVGLDGPGAEEVNRTATAALARAALDAGVRRFVQMSSYLVYAPAGDRPVREDDPLLESPESSFPAAKLGAEAALRQFTGGELEVCVLRVAFTYGEGDPHLADALSWAAHRPDDERLHLVHHADVRAGIFAALRSPAAAGHTYNLADDEPAPAALLRPLAEEFTARGAGAGDAEEGGPLGCVVDTTAARRDLGFRPVYPSIEDARRAGRM
ncbi:NAD-dependent epimerase/dehydratase family protein [Micromonospora aurantiaca]|uniref:NAD-dependent epimerase/dehydratase family protein n=2 Tax=Micromonospora TaxID=1873 RepID=UPI0037BBEBE2